MVGASSTHLHRRIYMIQQPLENHSMKKSITGLTALTALALAVPALAQRASTLKGAQLAPMAQVTLQDARAISLKARPGTIVDQELEKEAGGSGLRYSFDVKSGGKTYEVGVDAKTGAVLENAAEGKNPD
jgi:uncharacterized membrane protein YkoI